MSMWMAVTSVGRFTVMTPAALVIALWLAVSWRLRELFWWGGLYVGGMAIVVAGKIAFIGWGIGYQPWNFTGMSGHAMRVATVLPVLAYFLVLHASTVTRGLAVLLGVLLASLIAWSRVVVHAHSMSEAMSGYLFGLLLAGWFLSGLQGTTSIWLNRWLVLFSLLGLMGTPKLTPLPTQSWITHAALLLSGHAKPCTRQHWHQCVPDVNSRNNQ